MFEFDAKCGKQHLIKNTSSFQKEMKELVGYMGGNFFDPLITSTTHLVVNSILSEKYFVSTISSFCYVGFVLCEMNCSLQLVSS